MGYRIMERAFRFKEYKEINLKFVDDIEMVEESVERLKESVHILEEA